MEKQLHSILEGCVMVTAHYLIQICSKRRQQQNKEMQTSSYLLGEKMEFKVTGKDEV